MKLKIGIEKAEDLIFVVFLIVVANLLLSFVFTYPLLYSGKQLSHGLTSAILMINLLIYYLLFLSFLNYYTDIISRLIKKYKWITIILLVGLGLVAIVALSFYTLGMKETLQWLLPALLTLLTIILMRAYKNWKAEKNIHSKTPPQ